MQCGACGTTAGAGQRFCGACGALLQLACNECGYENPPDHRFCGGCGSPIDAALPSVASTVHAIERRVVSVMFVDLVGFTTFSEGRDPEDVRALITRYFDVARDAIERFGGTVDKFIGDAVMAWWGATTSNEDDAERAVRASLEVVDRVITLGEEVRIDGLTARVGVMTGEVSVGPGGNERGLLLGDLVNTASRLQSLAEPGTVLVGETTAGLVETAVELTPAGTHQLKGREGPVTAFRAARVVSERGGRGRSDFLEPPFVGRGSELRLLKDALHATGRDRHARLVSLVGQAGIGKSRLLWEFLKYIDGLVEVVYWHEGRSPSYGDGVAMWALGEMIRQRAGISETDDDEITLERLREMVGTYVTEERDRVWVEDRLAALLGLGGSVGAERTELFAAARLLFEGIAAHGTVVLVFEDLHWADPALLEFIDELPDWSQGHPILLVTLSRPDLLERRPEWGSGRRGFSSTYLGPLSDAEVTEMIEGAVPGIPTAATERIVGAAGGVPLFAVEMLRMLLAEGRLVIGSGGVEVTDDLAHLDVPSSVQAVVAARLDRLSSEERDLTRDAAVLGLSFTPESLAALRTESVDKIERRLAELVRREVFELIRDPRSPERGQYRWVQSVLREVAYGRISRSDRHDLHLSVARHLRDLGEPELTPMVASHFIAASEAAPSTNSQLQSELADALQAAIARAQVLHAHEQVLSLVKSAVGVVSQQVEFDLREIATLAAVRLSDVETIDEHTAAVTRLAEELGDVSSLHRAVALAGRVANENREPHAASDLLEPHLAAYPDLTADPDLARAAVYLARTRMLLGDEDGAADLADKALAAVERFDLIEEVADALVTRGTALCATRPRQAMVLLRGALELTRTHGLTDVMLRCLINIGYGSHDPDEKLRATEEAYAESKRVGDRSHAGFVAGNLASAYSLAMHREGIERILHDPVFRESDKVGMLGWRAEVSLWKGDRAAAEADLDEARALVADIRDPQTILNFERDEAAFAFYDGRGELAFETGRRHFHESVFAQPLSIVIAFKGASLLGDDERLGEVVEMASSLVPSPFHTAFVQSARGMMMVVSGMHEEGIAIIEDVIDARPESLRRFTFELLGLAAHNLPSEHPKRTEYKRRALAIAEATGSPGLTAWIELIVP